MSAISTQRHIGPLAFLDVIYQHVHRMLTSQHTEDWCAQSWGMVVQFGTPQVYFFKRNLKRYRKGQLGLYIYETRSMTGILEQLKWESLKTRRRDSRIIKLNKGLKGTASIPTNDLVPPIRHVRKHHSLAFQTPFANTDIYKSSLFSQTIRDWNSLTDSLLSAAEGAEDSVAKFTFLVRARD